jgi:hypothetical protein
VVAVCHLRQEHRWLAELSFSLWWEAYDVSIAKVRDSLRHFLPPRPRRKRGQDALAAAEAAVPAALHSGLPIARKLRRRLPAEDAHTALVALLLPWMGGRSVWTNTREDEDLDEKAPQDLVFKGLGLERAASDRVGDAGPWLATGATAVPEAVSTLQQTGVLTVEGLRELVNGATEAELTQAREDARLLAEGLPIVAKAAEALRGRNALGLGAIPASARTVRGRAMWVVACLALRRVLGSEPFEQLRQDLEPAVRAIRAVLDAHSREVNAATHS